MRIYAYIRINSNIDDLQKEKESFISLLASFDHKVHPKRVIFELVSVDNLLLYELFFLI